jgi:hypothetical protein
MSLKHWLLALLLSVFAVLFVSIFFVQYDVRIDAAPLLDADASSSADAVRLPWRRPHALQNVSCAGLKLLIDQ